MLEALPYSALVNARLDHNTTLPSVKVFSKKKFSTGHFFLPISKSRRHPAKIIADQD